MSSLADALAAANVATLRYQFPYMERGSMRVDSPDVAHAAVQAAVAEARRRLPALPFFAGGRSFGGRMTSQAQAISPLDGVRVLALVRSRCTRRARPAWSGHGTWRTSRCRFSSCRARATNWPSFTC
ncbi:alpha/beta family hydrolase [Caballeronia novacaledonica]|uniref:alpha/beta family hydrolase n=1 Tax=Caballeronia novacaledonica TaxID=1544861 RepID=UPI002852B512|nr:alpha/beta family hydrolase [Caballeronia novacaledonica]